MNYCKFKNLRIHPSVLIGSHGQSQMPSSVQIAQGTRIEMNTDSKLTLGENVKLCQRVHIYPQAGEVSIANNTSIQDDCRIYGNVSIGNNCLFAPNVFISSSSHVFSKEPSTPVNYQEAKYKEPQAKVTIGDDCWIGVNTYIAPGVNIGAGCIIGANSSVTKDIEPYSIAVGSPAKVIKKRVEFTPPSSISAETKQHWPYFYQGFSKSDSALITRGDFTLALLPTLGTSNSLQIEFESETSGQLQLAGQSVKFDRGSNSLIFKISQNGPFYKFTVTATLKHHRAELK